MHNGMCHVHINAVSYVTDSWTMYIDNGAIILSNKERVMFLDITNS